MLQNTARHRSFDSLVTLIEDEEEKMRKKEHKIYNTLTKSPLATIKQHRSRRQSFPSLDYDHMKSRKIKGIF